MIKVSGKKATKPHTNERGNKAPLLATPEGRILVLGLIFALIGITGLGLSLVWIPGISQILIAMGATNVLFGRAAGMSVGYTMRLGHAVVIPVAIYVETVLVLCFYPLFVFSWRQLLVVKALRNFMERTGRAAEIHRETIRKYGMAGLFIFVWIPFWMTGPVVGCAIGFLLNLKPYSTIVVVLAGTYFAITCWGFFLKELHIRVAEYNPYAPLILVAIVIMIAAGAYILNELRRESRTEKQNNNH